MATRSIQSDGDGRQGEGSSGAIVGFMDSCTAVLAHVCKEFEERPIETARNCAQIVQVATNLLRPHDFGRRHTLEDDDFSAMIYQRRRIDQNLPTPTRASSSHNFYRPPSPPSHRAIRDLSLNELLDITDRVTAKILKKLVREVVRFRSWDALEAALIKKNVSPDDARSCKKKLRAKRINLN